MVYQHLRRLYVGIIFNFTIRRLLIFFNFQNSIRAHVRHRAFATVQIELYHVVTMIASGLPKYMKIVCGIILNFTLRRLLIYFLIYKIVLGLMSDTELLQHSKLNGTE